MRLSSILAAGLALVSVSSQAASVLNRPNIGEPESLDPQKTVSSYPIGIVRDMYMGLVTLTNDGKPAPGVAETWEIAPDGKTWTFHLRHDTKWSNGDPVTSEDFLYSFRRLVDPKTAAADPSDLKQVVNYEAIIAGQEKDLTKLGVEAPDKYTLVLHLIEPRLALRFLLTDPQLFPLHRASIEKWGNDWTRPGHVVTNGPYMMQDWVPQGQIVMVKNPNFYDAAALKIDTVNWIEASQFDASLKRYQAGELDWVELRRAHYPWAKANMADQLHHADDNSYSFMNINMAKGPLAGDIRLREALNLALDRDLIVSKINPLDQKPAYSITPALISDYTPQDMPLKSMSQAERTQRAKELVAAAGYSPDRPLKISVSYPTEENTRQLLLAFRQILMPIGIELTLSNMEWQAYVGIVNARNFDVGMMGLVGSYDDYENGLDNFRSDAGEGNPCGYSNKAFDDLFHRGGTATDINTRRELMQQAEKVVLADYALVPVYFGVLNRLVNPKLQGVLDATRVPQTRFLSFKE